MTTFKHALEVIRKYLDLKPKDLEEAQGMLDLVQLIAETTLDEDERPEPRF